MVGFDSIKGVINSEFSALRTSDKIDLLWKSFAKLAIIFTVLGLIILVFIVIFRYNIIDYLLPGFNGNKRELAVNVFLIITPVFLFKIIFSFTQAINNAFKKYYLPVLVPALINFTIVGSLLFSYYNNILIYNLAIGITVGNFLIIVIMIVSNIKLGARFSVSSLAFDDITKKVLKSVTIMVVIVIVNQLFFVSRNYLTSYMPDGSLSVLNYSTMVPNIFSVSIFTIFFNVLLNEVSSLLSVNAVNEAKDTFYNVIISIFYFIVPAVITLLICKSEILELIFLRGNFTPDKIELLYAPYMFEVLALIPYVIFICFVSLYLASKSYILFSKIGIPVFLFGILTNYLLSMQFGLYGISLSYFIISILYAAFLYYFSKKIFGKSGYFLKVISKILFSGFIVYLVLSLCNNLIGYKPNNIVYNILFISINLILVLSFYYLLTRLLKADYFKKIFILYQSKQNKSE